MCNFNILIIQLFFINLKYALILQTKWKAGQLDPKKLLKLKNSRIKRLKKYEAKESEERGSGLVEFVGDGAG